MSVGPTTATASSFDSYDPYAAGLQDAPAAQNWKASERAAPSEAAADAPKSAAATAVETSSSRLASASLPPEGLSSPNVGNSQGNLVAGRTFPRDAFVDTTTSKGWFQGYTYSREAQLRNERSGVSVEADVKVTRSSDGRTLKVDTNASYQDTTGKPIAKVYVEELPLVDGKKPTGQSWSFGGNASTTGGGFTLGGSNSDINTTAGTPSRRTIPLASNNGGGSYAIPIDDNSRELQYKFSVTVVYKDGTSSGPVQVAAPSAVK